MPRNSEICFKLDGEEILIHFVEDEGEQEGFDIKEEIIEDESSLTVDQKQFLRVVDYPKLIGIKNSTPTEEIINDQDNTTSEKNVKKYICNTCGGDFRFIRRHLESHGPYNCMDCLLNFNTEALYDDHLMTAHNNDTERFTCDYCSLGFTSFTNLALHKFEHTKQYTCPICNFTVKGRYRNSLVNHIKRHEGKYAIKCDICGQGFVEKNFLVSHMEMHEAIPKYECEICKKKFTVKRYLDVHKSYNHKKELYGIEEMFQCEVCGRSFTFEKSLIRHLSCIHKIGEDRTVECQVCHKTIANNHNLKKHMRTHTGEKRFCCDTCGKAFSEKKYLNKHQNVHKKERLRKPRKLLEVESSGNEDSNFASFVKDEEQNELISEATDFFVEDYEVDDAVDKEDTFYFSVD